MVQARSAGAFVRVRSGGTTRRRPSDAVRVVVATAVLVGLAFHADSPTATERAVVRWFDTLPKAAETFFLVFYDLLALWAVLLLVVTILFVRRWRLARDLLVAGALAWLLGRVLAFVWGRTSLGKAFELIFDVANAPRFPTVRVAIAVAMVIVASPHLTRPVRRVGQVLVALIALERDVPRSRATRRISSAPSCSAGVSPLRSTSPSGRPTAARPSPRCTRRSPGWAWPWPTCTSPRISPSGEPSSPVMGPTAGCG